MATKSAYMNGVGVYLNASGWASLTFKATSEGQIVDGTKGANFLYDTIGGDSLVGGSGDNTYFVISDNTIVEQAADNTTNTVDTGLNYYVLPTNVQNLTATSNDEEIVGNSENNLIILDGGGDHLTNGTGDDAIVEESWSTGSNVFNYAPGAGEDSIYGFNVGASTHDYIELDGYGFTSYAQVAADMKQQGANVIVELSPTNSITIENVQLSSLNSDDFLLPVDVAELTPTFKENFNNLILWNRSVGGDVGWKTNFFFAGQGESGTEAYTSRYLSSGGYNDLELYTDPSFQGTSSSSLGLDPFSTQNGILTITATKVSAATAAHMSGHTWSSGLLTTEKSYSQTYGYFEIRAKLPSGAGMDSAFWLWADNNNSSELDVFEQPNGSSEILQTAHGVNGAAKSFQSRLPTDTSQFNTYGVLWTSTTITFYINGVATGSTPTPSNMHGPMYMLTNLGVGGGGWEGTPTAGETTGQMQIDYIDAFSLADSSSAILASGGSSAALTLTAAQALAYEAGTTSLDPTGAAFVVSDTTANIASNLNALNSYSKINSITLTDTGVPTLTLTVAEALDDFRAIDAITNASYSLVVKDTVANLRRLTSTQIQTLAAAGVTALVATNGSVSYELQTTTELQSGDVATIEAFAQSLNAAAGFTELAGSTLSVASGEILTIGGAATFDGTVSGFGALALAGGNTTFGTGATVVVANLSETGTATKLTLAENLSYSGTFSQAIGTTTSVASGDELTLTGVTNLRGMMSGAGKLALAGGSATISGGAKFSVSNWSISGAATKVATTQQVTYAGIFTEGVGATITTTDGFVLTGMSDSLRGTVNGSKTFFTEGSAKAADLTIGGTVQWYNTATVTQSGGAVTLGDATGAIASVYNASTATYDITDDSGLGHGSSAASSFDNQGLFEKSGGTGTSVIAVSVGNGGTISATSGTLDLQGALSATGKDDIGAATLEVDGSVSAGQTFAYTAANGELALDDLDVAGSNLFLGSISGFAAEDSLDAGAFGTGTNFLYSENSGNASGVLTLTNGAMKASIDFLGDYSQSNFVAKTDAHGGTLLSFHA